VKILISTWGSPWKYPESDPKKFEDSRWKKVSYKVQVEPASGKTYTSRTTTIPLIEELKPNLVLILGTDTVVAPSEGSENYEELLKAAKKKYRVFLEANYEIAGFAPGIDLQKNVQIAIIPFPGEFQLGSPSNSAKRSLRSEVDPSDMRAFLLWEITKAIYTAIGEASKTSTDKKITIAVDTSHGFNVVPALAYSIVRELADALSLFYDVDVQEFNSAPVEGDLPSNGLKEIPIMRVDSYKGKQFSGLSFDKPDAVISSEGLRGIKIGSESQPDAQILNPLCQISRDDLLAFVAGVAYAFPLVIYRFFPDHHALFECGEAITKKWISDSKVTTTGSEVTLGHPYRLQEDFKLLAYSMLISRILSGINLQKKDRISKSDVELLRENVYKANPLWDYVLSSTERDLFDTRSEPDIRNFIAHSGLTWKLIQITSEGKENYVGYLPGKEDYVKEKLTKKLYNRSKAER